MVKSFGLLLTKDIAMPGGLEWHQVNDIKAVDTFADFKGYNAELTKGLKGASQGHLPGAILGRQAW